MDKDNSVNANSSLRLQNMGLQAAGDKDSNGQGTKNKQGSINLESSLLANAPILRSILKKAVRNVPCKDQNTSMSSVSTNVSGFNDKNACDIPTCDANELHSVGQQGDVDEVPLVGGIAAKVQNLDGKILGRDGKVLKQSRMVHFADQVEVLPTEQHKDEVAGNGMSSGVGKAARGTPTQVAQAASNSQGLNSNSSQPLVYNVGSGNINGEGWDWTSNGSFYSSGSRIVLGWNVDAVDLNVVAMTDQLVHTFIRFKADKKELFCSFVYAHNRYTHRRPLWDNLGLHKQLVRNRPWCVLGDFNSALNLEDKIEGSLVIDIAMREFKECVDANELVDINCSGLQFTWTQKPRGLDGTLRKIDRIMDNLGFLDSFAGAHAIFQPYRVSDHSPAIIHIPTTCKFKPRPFKLSNILVQNSRFKQQV
ncbi:RNA-directed DNA polymerase, eukaryota, Reverse transcriptase zinc-binding domain protein [Artemisia annua]|uniref:RNA-directed DNA polymerase, eukaryota, Reverse transcriptase zinc-binding domain protein n=1 Tax=Artemisia annua TaxID=35608 RepID=A0A2U1MLU0_ARTAN|nr:RNA-directed DNA polymerase, eukaryota, Reverse transcriptase zinc-binding domain protein [Artemisia annua]